MNALTAFFKKLNLSKVVMVFLAGVVLMFTTACNTGDELGARPNVSPVQMGGSNNPHKAGGDGYTEYKASTDRSAVKGNKKQANLPTGLLVAEVNSNASDLLYPASDATDTKSPAIGHVGAAGKEQFAKDAQQIPAERQPVIDRSDPDAKILEKSGQAFKDASGFLKDTTETFTDRAGAVANPGISKKGNKGV